MAGTSTVSWDALVPFIVWQFLIPLGAGWTQTVLYSIFIRAGDRKPPPGSPRFVRHRRWILITVYLAYFGFTIYEADFHVQRQSHAYRDLGVPVDVDDSALQRHFRKLTVRFHPDKVRAGGDREQASEYYVTLRHAKDIILDPAKRFAYDRFGPDVLEQCSKCLTVKEYVDNGLITAATMYGALLLVLIGCNALGFLKDGAYWRYLAILAVAAFDLRTVLRADHSTFLTQYLNPLVTTLHLRPAYLPFQLTTVVKKAAISAAQFLGLLIPLYRDDPQQTTQPIDDSDDTRHKQVDRLDAVVSDATLDASRLLDLESTPYRENEKAKSELREALRKYMVQNVVHQEKDVRNAIGQSMARRRAGAPHGAQGTR
ncbi:hypothetical protein BDV95DRAFT_532495 [Massariosphaeria phaeospora]|uniref:J domain-containing protein n=1 Tax=Massariosphaeria phaeospora TaxID=100035 RepID=A0A7C8I0J2_9PLEO|nr:hypothetical protein BDV95DRAFT_532495 [Massariosphaeria phaeospora]